MEIRPMTLTTCNPSAAREAALQPHLASPALHSAHREQPDRGRPQKYALNQVLARHKTLWAARNRCKSGCIGSHFWLPVATLRPLQGFKSGTYAATRHVQWYLTSGLALPPQIQQIESITSHAKDAAARAFHHFNNRIVWLQSKGALCPPPHTLGAPWPTPLRPLLTLLCTPHSWCTRIWLALGAHRSL